MKRSKNPTWRETNSNPFPKRREKAPNEQVLSGRSPVTKVAIGDGCFMARRMPLSDAFAWNSEDY